MENLNNIFLFVVESTLTLCEIKKIKKKSERREVQGLKNKDLTTTGNQTLALNIDFYRNPK